MTLDTISLGSCPTCGGPAQFIDPASANLLELDRAQTDLQPTAAGFVVRRVELPNIDEDLGDGWRLSGLDWSAVAASKDEAAWTARGWHPHRPGFVQVAADTPTEAYLGLLTAIEARR